MKKHSSFSEQRESVKGAKSVRRDSREVMSELVAQLRKQVDAESVAVRGKDKDVPDGESPNLDRLTVGVDLGDQWSNYCILRLGGETPTEGQFRTRRQEIAAHRVQASE